MCMGGPSYPAPYVKPVPTSTEQAVLDIQDKIDRSDSNFAGEVGSKALKAAQAADAAAVAARSPWARYRAQQNMNNRDGDGRGQSGLQIGSRGER